uniref:Putative secreted protein n=1 Tax=Aedes aegypti TaxID=7159 RepID=Q8T9U8_AEDAE|nr:putative secreted protein [Aedes aegypti]
MKVYICQVIFSFLAVSVFCEENCNIPESELSKIDHVLRHMEKPIYSEEQFASDNEECTNLLNGIHAQLRRLTQRYKLMNKGYVKVEEYQRMADNYEKQLKTLNDELVELQQHTSEKASATIAKLKEDIKKLDEEVGTLHEKLKGIKQDFEKVKRDLCVTYLNSNQMSKAKAKLKEMASTYLIEIVQQQLNKSNANIMPMLEFSAAIPDLDDMGEAYKEIYKFLEEQKRLEGEDSVLLEATVLKMNASLKEGSNITDERRTQIEGLLKDLATKSTIVFSTWTKELKKINDAVVIKNALDHMFVSQMKVFGALVGDTSDFGSIRNFVKLTIVCNNYYKVAAYKELIDRKIGNALGTIMFDLLTLEVNEMKFDPHVPDEIPKLFEATLSSLPNSLTELRTCLGKVQIYNKKTNKCVVATGNDFDVHKDKLGDFYRVVVADYGCTSFRLEASGDKASVRIVTPSGNPMSNVNLHLEGNSLHNYVATPKSNKPDRTPSSSDEWILDANYNNDTIKIESQFSDYKTKKTEVDHLLVRDINHLPHVLVARYGFMGLKNSDAKDTIEWNLKCGS